MKGLSLISFRSTIGYNSAAYLELVIIIILSISGFVKYLIKNSTE